LQSFDSPHFQAYSPKAVEAAWYTWWENSSFFQPQSHGEAKPSKKFVIPLPPPNVTGALHCGHAWKEKKIRLDLGREQFTKLVWEWKDEYRQRINNAQRLMGESMDWSREAFTMDENLTAATMEAFCRLFDEGYIYRSNRLVNWCTHLRTALSLLEVENKEVTGRTLLSVPGYEKKVEFGVLTFFKYPIDGTANETIEVATTRPETMLGDSGIAMHPDDSRYTHLVGQ
jgi:valyl-tRNA synthetase